MMAYALGMMIGAAGKRIAALETSIEGRPPTAEEDGQLQQIVSRLAFYGRSNGVLVVVAVGSMASARFV